MPNFASTTVALKNSLGKLPARDDRFRLNTQYLGSITPILRKSTCACGGGCPACQAKSFLNISHPNDPTEIEADEIADRVLRMPDGAKAEEAPKSTTESGRIHRKCNACEHDDEELKVQRKALPSPGADSAVGPDHVREAIGAGGQPLDEQTQDFFGSRLGYDLSAVRIHTGGAAAKSARSLNAQAYTLGNDIVFGGGDYAPHSDCGRRLLAHELAHVTQQNTNELHRRLRIDAGASENPATAITMMEPLITQLCPDFETDSATGEITPRARSACTVPDFPAVAGGGNPIGCCCLCTMTRPWGANWTIIVTSIDAPTTDPGNHVVRMTPTTGPNAPEFRHWTPGSSETLATQSPVEVLGHELCGHAALMKINAHEAASTDRAYDDQHDSTVRVQNALAVEMGLGGSRRGLAAGGTHRGESLRVFSVGPFGVNETNPAPFSAQIAAAAAFLNGKPGLLVDTVGFRGGADTLSGVSAGRAIRVRDAIIAALLKPTVAVETSPGANETLPRVQPITDGGAGASAVVELRMAIRPAGLNVPIGVAPPSPPVPVGPSDPRRVTALKGGRVNQCHQLLAKTAWP